MVYMTQQNAEGCEEPVIEDVTEVVLASNWVGSYDA
jgi:hypothetical protein